MPNTSLLDTPDFAAAKLFMSKTRAAVASRSPTVRISTEDASQVVAILGILLAEKVEEDRHIVVSINGGKV